MAGPERALDEVDEAEVIARYRKGASIPQLAARFEVGWTTIRRTLERAGETRRPAGFQRQYDVSDEAILYLRDDCGLPWAEIATRTGMRPSGVRRRYDTAKRRVATVEGR